MITAVKIKNFQAHRDTEVEFGHGINLIRGANTIGKSSLSRAIVWSLFCQGGADYVTWGEKECGVSVCFDDGIRVTRLRSDKVAKYVLGDNGDNQEWNRHGTTVPEEISRAVSLYPITVDDECDKIINYSEQGELPFLIYDSAASIERQLGKLVGTHELEQAAKKAKLDLDRGKRSLKNKEEALAGLGTQLSQYDWVDIAKPKMESLMELEGEIEELKYTARELASVLAKLEGLDTKGEHLPVLVEEADNVAKVISDIEGKVKESKQLSDLLAQLVAVGIDIERQNGNLAEFGKGLEELRKAYYNTLRKAKVCPICGQTTKECEH